MTTPRPRPTCRVHGVPLLPGHTQIVYGYPAPREPGGPEEAEERDAADAEAIYGLLEKEIVPLYYRKAGDGIPHDWRKQSQEPLALLNAVCGQVR